MRIDLIKKSESKKSALEHLAELKDLKEPGASPKTIRRAERLIERMYG